MKSILALQRWQSASLCTWLDFLWAINGNTPAMLTPSPAFLRQVCKTTMQPMDSGSKVLPVVASVVHMINDLILRVQNFRGGSSWGRLQF